MSDVVFILCVGELRAFEVKDACVQRMETPLRRQAELQMRENKRRDEIGSRRYDWATHGTWKSS